MTNRDQAYLISSNMLKKHLDDSKIVLVDIGAEAAYSRGHIPGAIMLLDDYERNSETGLVHTFPPDRFAATCEALGIGDDTQVVVYDNNLSLYAARFWWVLNYYGHQRVRVLDGGWRGWVTEGLPTSFERTMPNQNLRFTPSIDNSLIVELEEIKETCSLPGVVVWDTRTVEEYDGTVNRGNRRKGHVAGAVHLQWSDLMEADTHRFKPPQELRRILGEVGITPDKAIYAY